LAIEISEFEIYSSHEMQIYESKIELVVIIFTCGVQVAQNAVTADEC